MGIMYVRYNSISNSVDTTIITANPELLSIELNEGESWKEVNSAQVQAILKPIEIVKENERIINERKIEYDNISNFGEFMEAVIEAIVENRPEKLNAIQEQRLAIKRKLPKVNG